jgi:hypothetical protein
MLILDTSVVLNLVGTGNPRLIIRHLPTQAFMPQAVLREVQREPQAAKESSLADLLHDGSISLIECTAEMTELALVLAGAPAPDDLDDGESYAISCAVCSGAAIGVDDQKARRILTTRWPQLDQYFSVDLITIAAAQGKLQSDQHAELVYLALKNTRMRVPKNRRVEVIRLIGRERARECPSLGIIL